MFTQATKLVPNPFVPTRMSFAELMQIAPRNEATSRQDDVVQDRGAVVARPSPDISHFQNRFPGRAKWCPTAPDHSPGLIPTNTMSRSGPRTSGIVRPCAASSSAFEGSRGQPAMGARSARGPASSERRASRRPIGDASLERAAHREQQDVARRERPQVGFRRRPPRRSRRSRSRTRLVR
jgi:hypothetical protein